VPGVLQGVMLRGCPHTPRLARGARRLHTLQCKVSRRLPASSSFPRTWLPAALAACCLGFPLASLAQDQNCPQAADQQDLPQDQQQGAPDAQDAQTCPTPLSRSLAAIKAYVTAPARWDRSDWLFFGGAMAAIGVAYQFDARVHTQLIGNVPVSAHASTPASLQDALPAAALFAGTWGYARLIDDEDGIREAHAMLEAGALSFGAATAFSYLAGRDRPNQSVSPHHWRAGGSSFPSEHTTAAFAIGTVLAESGNPRYRWVRRVLGYGVAGFTAYERLKHNAHWLSDTVAGAALGVASAHFAMNRERAAHPRGDFAVVPMYRGMMLTYQLQLN
jgi:membrane-associated phospholipid phosphatase